ncbi:MAG: hypothetical protein ACI90M_004173, partial [Candidatus Azotimanducaceae bacterium]
MAPFGQCYSATVDRSESGEDIRAVRQEEVAVARVVH